MNFFITEGEKKLKEEEEKLLSGEFVDEEDLPVVVEESKEHRGGFRGGRGGRGGARGGYGRTGTAAAGGDRRKKRDEDDDVYVSSGDEDQRVTAKLAKRPSNKKENLALDDNNYPTL